MLLEGLWVPVAGLCFLVFLWIVVLWGSRAFGSPPEAH